MSERPDRIADPALDLPADAPGLRSVGTGRGLITTALTSTPPPEPELARIGPLAPYMLDEIERYIALRLRHGPIGLTQLIAKIRGGAEALAGCKNPPRDLILHEIAVAHLALAEYDRLAALKQASERDKDPIHPGIHNEAARQ